MDACGACSMEDRLARTLQPGLAGLSAVANLRMLSGGAVQETWSFDALCHDGPVPLILRRARGRIRAERRHGIDLAAEAEVVRLAEAGGVPVPHVHRVLEPDDGLGNGFVTDFIAGETIPRRILRDPAFAGLRAGLAAECGRVLATIHRLDPSRIPGLEVRQPVALVAQMERDYRELHSPSAAFELAFRRLAETMLPDVPALSLVHGDFRNGNLIVGPEGLRAVLDWEGAHVGDPHEDLAYISVPSWRFGELDQPVGGFGTREALFAAYEQASGQPVDPTRIAFWELAFTMNWGIQCGQMAEQFLTGLDPSVERGAIGRRRSEAELDVLTMLDPEYVRAR